MHHSDHLPCPRCALKVSQAHIEIQKMWEMIKKEFPDCHISSTFRDEAEQNQYFKEGKSKLKWPKSKHNTIKDGVPCAEAMDLFQLTPDNIAHFDDDYYASIYYFLIRNLMPIEWAGTWSKMKESTHFELAGDE